MEALYPVIVLFVLFFLNIPIAFALMGSALFYFIFLNTTMSMDMVIQQFVTSVESFPYLAVPFFIMVGSVMNYSGISEELMNMAEVLAGHMKGGLAQVNCLLSAMMGGISGSANADAAMESKILVPEMIKKGFSKEFSAAVTAASSAVSPVIPPGTNLILYALIANVPVGDMFLAGYTPGILMTLSMMITVYIISKKRGYEPSRERMARPLEIIKQAIKSIWALAIPFGIIMGMRIGIFTPTEAGGVAVFFCFLVGFFVYKKLKLHHIPIILMETVKSTGAVMIIIASAKVFGYYMTLERIPQFITNRKEQLKDDNFEASKVLTHIDKELNSCEEFAISVAFITESGFIGLAETFRKLESRGIRGRILTTDYLCFSEPSALEKLANLKNIELKMYHVDEAKVGFHTKGYLFKKDGIHKLILGSSNMTAGALSTNKEWNVKLVSTVQGKMAQDIVNEFEMLWKDEAAKLYTEFIDSYRKKYEGKKQIDRLIKEQHKTAISGDVVDYDIYRLKPNKMQQEFIYNIHKLIEQGAKKAMLISATGTGKTFASAFAMKNENPPKALFIVHRELIAKQALNSYQMVFGSSKRLGLLSGNSKEYDADI